MSVNVYHALATEAQSVLTLTMLWCCIRVRMAISWLTWPSMGSSTQDSLTILALLMNFTTTWRFANEVITWIILSLTSCLNNLLTSCPSHRLVAFQTKPKAPFPTLSTGRYSSSNCPSQALDCSRSIVVRNAPTWLASPICYRREKQKPSSWTECNSVKHFCFCCIMTLFLLRVGDVL